MAKHRGPNDPAMPPYIVLNVKSRSHIAWPGYLGKQYEPLLGTTANGLFNLPAELHQERLRTRHDLLVQFDRLSTGAASRLESLPSRLAICGTVVPSSV